MWMRHSNFGNDLEYSLPTLLITSCFSKQHGNLYLASKCRFQYKHNKWAGNENLSKWKVKVNISMVSQKIGGIFSTSVVPLVEGFLVEENIHEWNLLARFPKIFHKEGTTGK